MPRETQLMKAITTTLMVLVGATLEGGSLRKVVEEIAKKHDLPAADVEAGVCLFVLECDTTAREDAAREEAASAGAKAGSEMARDAKRGGN